MPEYRAFLVDSDGHFHSARVIDAPNDDAAVEAAKPLVDGCDVEVWQRDRKIAVLSRVPFSSPLHGLFTECRNG